MTRTRARSTKRKYFWAARDKWSKSIWNHRGVFLFGPSRKPTYIGADGDWRGRGGVGGGTMCYGVFTRLTGVVLKPGQVKKVYVPLGAFRAYEVSG